jgi:hypothetical protein
VCLWLGDNSVILPMVKQAQQNFDMELELVSFIIV